MAFLSRTCLRARSIINIAEFLRQLFCRNVATASYAPMIPPLFLAADFFELPSKIHAK